MILGGYENSCRSIFCSAVLCNHLHFWHGAIRRQKNIRMLERVHHEISSHLSCKYIRISLHQKKLMRFINRSFSSLFMAYFSSLFPSVRLDNLASYAIHQFQIHTSICACTLCKYNHSFVGYFPILHKTYRRGK